MTRGWFRHVVFGFCLAIGASGCSAADEDASARVAEPVPLAEHQTQASSPSAVCGMNSMASPSSLADDPCVSGEVLLAETFERDTSSPYHFRNIALPEDSRLCLKLEDVGVDSVYPKVRLDGEALAHPSQFNANSEPFRLSLDVSEGAHQLEVRLSGHSQAALAVELRALPAAEVHPLYVGTSGILEVTNVAIDHPLFSPNGDGYHDTALFNADNFPRELPGKETGLYDYYLNWSWEVIDATTCSSLGVVQSGSTQVNSPTNVQALWDGSNSASLALASSTTTSGSSVDDGSYLYQYNVELVRSDGMSIDSASSEPQGFEVDSSDVDFDGPHFGDGCDPEADPYECQCPGGELDNEERCTFAWIPYLDQFDDLSQLDTSQFLMTSYDDSRGRWVVIADLREFNGGGLVPQTSGTWQSVEQLQEYIEQLTGVPTQPDQKQLFNFDFIQLGYSTPVIDTGVVDGFNHLLLDVITDQHGMITIDGQTLDVSQILATGEPNLPEEYVIDEEREGNECAYNGNTDGETTVTAKSCTELVSINLDPGQTDIGIYRIDTRIFDMKIDKVGTTRDQHCIINGIYKCGVRSFQRDGRMALKRELFAETGEITLEGTDGFDVDDLPALRLDLDRDFEQVGSADVIDGVCARGVAVRSGSIEIPLDSADGALPSSCIINGIY